MGGGGGANHPSYKFSENLVAKVVSGPVEYFPPSCFTRLVRPHWEHHYMSRHEY